jgi:hypothetical protein
MAKIQFVPKNFSASSKAIIDIVNNIVNEYARQGYRLSLRQLYYQLVARDYIPNSVQSYKRIGGIVSDARDAGLIDWGAIEDRGRVPQLPSAWESPAEIVKAAAEQFRVNRWEGQENYVEVMVEKDALTGILLPVCRRLHVRFTANKGYSSSTAMFDAGERMREALSDPEGTASYAHILYFGDHDPSGIDMTRDITERLCLYSRLDGFEDYVQIHRLALNYSQVEQWNPPPNPAKETDSRFAGYQVEFGDESWELDAVEPRTLASLVEDQIKELIDEDVWEEVEKREQKMKRELLKFAKDYEAKNGAGKS